MAPHTALLKRNKPGLYYKLFLVFVVFLTYANTLSNGFVFDDKAAVTENQLVKKGIQSIPDILFSPYHSGYVQNGDVLYRPLSLILFTIEYQLFGQAPVAFHLFNILYYIVCVLLFYRLMNMLFDQKLHFSFIATLLFALHPIHTEVVANIKSRDEILCFLFTMLSVILFVTYSEGTKVKYLVGGGVSFLLALLSKESAVTLLGVIPIVLYMLNKNKRNSVFIISAAVVSAVVFFLLRMSAINTLVINTHSVSFVDNSLAFPDIPFSSKLATGILVLGNYLKLLFVPYPLISDYSYNVIPLTDFTNIWVWLTVVLYVGLLVITLLRLFKNRKDPIAFGICIYLIFISLFTNVFFLVGVTMAERFLFLPSIGFCVAVGYLLCHLFPNTESADSKSFNKVWIVLTPVLLLYAGLVYSRNQEWSSDLKLFSADVKKAPGSAKINLWVGNELVKAADKASSQDERDRMKWEGIDYLKTSLSIVPEFDLAHSSIGSAYLDVGKPDLAEYHEKAALKINSANYLALNTLAAVYFQRGQYIPAILLSRRSVQLHPQLAMGYVNTGLGYFAIKRTDSALHYLEQAASIDPAYPTVNKYLAIINAQIGNLQAAKRYESLEQQNNPQFSLGHSVISK